jgi:isoleucyl-tRNA synthetase
LIQEGAVRDIVRCVQSLRKERGLNVTDRINLSIHGSKVIRKAVESFADHLTCETLAVSWKWKKETDAEEVPCGDESCYISLSKASS